MTFPEQHLESDQQDLSAAVQERVAELKSGARPLDPKSDQSPSQAEKESLERLEAIIPSDPPEPRKMQVTALADLPLADIERYRKNVVDIAKAQRQAASRSAYRMVD